MQLLFYLSYQVKGNKKRVTHNQQFSTTWEISSTESLELLH
uniref:Uncharacterized protein n=1 Tax=Arundo donax TaxID=35708 RepID=A0A0A9ECI4_ARUDO